jgi:hypothetical protein
MPCDPIVEEVRRVREELAAKFEFDLHAMFAVWKNREASLGDRVVDRAPVRIAPANDLVRNLPGKNYDFKSIGELKNGLDAHLCRVLLLEVLPKLSILDPACGSGAFLVAAMKTLIDIYGSVIGQAKASVTAPAGATSPTSWLAAAM